MTLDRGDDFVPAEAQAASSTAPEAQSSDETALISATERETPHDGAAPNAAEVAPAAQAEARDEKGRFIPKARFDEAVQKERERSEAAERQLAELQKQLAQVTRTADVSALEEQLTELRKAERRAIMDGNEDKSVELAGQIDRMNRQIAIQEAQHMSAQAREEATESMRFDMAVERLEGMYDVLRNGSDTYDQSLVDLVLAKQEQLIRRDRMSPSQAIVAAATDIMTRFQPAARADERPAAGLGAKAAEQRTVAAKTKAVDAAVRTPPSLQDVGLDTDKAGMTAGVAVPVTIAELMALPEATRKRLRGDLL